MLERLLIVGVVAALVLASSWLVRAWIVARVRRARRAPVPAELVPLIRPGRPTVLAFSTPGCTECRALQLPALRQLGARLREQVTVAHVSVPEHPTLVEHYGILTVPATVILDASGTVRHVNLRFASVDRLHSQVLESAA